MFIILGGTGHVGSATAAALLAAGEAVTVVTRDAGKAAGLRAQGAVIAIADVTDTAGLRAILRRGRRAFLLNPPADPSTDTDAEERRTADCIVAALDGAGLEKVVLESTYGAQPGERIGDLSVLHEFEQGVVASGIPATALRAAYYMSNWDALLDAAKAGSLPTMIPAYLALPMVAPADLGAAAARLLREPVDRTGVQYVEGPERYTPADVASAFAAALGRAVESAVIPREGWEDAFSKLGFSAEAAASYANMTAVSVDGGYDMPADPERGATTLRAYIAGLVA